MVRRLLIWYNIPWLFHTLADHNSFTYWTNIGIRPWLMVTGSLSYTSAGWFLTDMSSLKVAVDRTQPNGRVLGVDIIPAQPPKGVSTIQGNFLAPEIQAYVREFLQDPKRGRPRQLNPLSDISCSGMMTETSSNVSLPPSKYPVQNCAESSEFAVKDSPELEWTVDVVLSDMSAPWHQTTGFWKRSLSNPYNRMMNTSGMNFRDHVGSMVWFFFSLAILRYALKLTLHQDLCRAALRFSFEALKSGGHFVCKFYQGTEDKDLEKQLKGLFQRVHRMKPESSRNVCIRYMRKLPHVPTEYLALISFAGIKRSILCCSRAETARITQCSISITLVI